MRIIEYTVTEEFSCRPLLHFLKRYVKLSTHIVQSLRHTEGSVLINGAPARVVDKVTAGDKLTLKLPEKTTPPLLWETPLDIIFEDADLLVLNKPSGVSVHPTKNHPNGTLCNAVASYLIKNGCEPSASRAVGRLDKVTSGVIIFAKNSFAASRLNGNLDKTYTAIVNGITDSDGTIDAPIYRPDFSKTLRAVGESGDRAITHYRALAYGDGKTLVEIKTETGRTHQIRVHFSHINHTLCGDEMYGAPTTAYLKRAALHCSEVTVTHPVKNEKMTFSAPIPNDMKNELNNSFKQLQL